MTLWLVELVVFVVLFAVALSRPTIDRDAYTKKRGIFEENAKGAAIVEPSRSSFLESNAFVRLGLRISIPILVVRAVCRCFGHQIHRTTAWIAAVVFVGYLVQVIALTVFAGCQTTLDRELRTAIRPKGTTIGLAPYAGCVTHDGGCEPVTGCLKPGSSQCTRGQPQTRHGRSSIHGWKTGSCRQC